MVTMLIAAWLAFGWQAASPATPQQAALVSGRVLDADSGAPLAGVTVGAARAKSARAVTDADGQYTLRVPPGRHVLHARAEVEHITFSLAVPRPVDVPAGGDLRGVDFHVRLEASVSGRVLDEQDRPIPGVQVLVVSRAYSRSFPYGSAGEVPTGLWRFLHASAATDDRGTYTIPRLFAGRAYRLLAYRPLPHVRAMSLSPDDPAERAPTLAATWFPAAETFETAAPVVLTSLEQREGVDIRMRSAPSFCVEATTTAGGEPAPLEFAIEDEAVAALVTAAQTSRPRWRTLGSSGADGRVRACDLPPGRFRITAGGSLAAWSDGPLGSTTFDIGDQDLRDVVVAADAPAAVTGRVEWAGAATATREGPVRLRVVPATGGARVEPTTVPGAFSMSLLPGLEYGLSVDQLTPGEYVRDVTLDGRSLMLEPLAIPAGAASADLHVILAGDAGALAVTVTADGPAPAPPAVVFALPADAATGAEIAAGLRAALTDERGAARIEGLRPGPYRVLATTTPPPVIFQYPGGHLRLDPSPETMDLLLRVRARGERVDVAPRGLAAVTLRAGPVR